MYLKRLESIGFKSFAERIKIDFVKGVTAIVGPNGSGKSNITDAIRWVLGEQSARSLRGSKMEDIIFQGSDSRNPLNVAEVSLVLDNSNKTLPIDYDEVNVTRRVYRSGVSEFYINKQACRLKDIIDLFMDSGLGREAFSIISQGKVEEILSSKAEERRVIFEEAAGVLKYKHRKQKAEYKLSETEENLSRIKDIIYEIEQQIEPLEEQAKKAKKYLSLKDQLKKQEIALIITEIDHLYKKWKKLNELIEEEQLKEIECKTFIQRKESELEEARKTIQTKDEWIEQLQQKLLRATQQKEHLEGEKRVLLERNKHHVENKSNIQTEIEEEESKVKELKKSLAKEKDNLVELLQLRDQSKEKVKQIKKRLSIDSNELAEKIEEYKADYIELLNEQAANRNEITSITNQLQQLSGQKAHHMDKHNKLKKDMAELEKHKQYRSSDYEEQLAHLDEKMNILEKLNEKLTNEKSHFTTLQQKLTEGYQVLSRLQSRQEFLEEMRDEFQGFYHGVKSVLKAKNQRQLTNIHGAVIELIAVPDDYVTAIETALGAQAQHIVVDNDESARKAIAWLRKSNNGRATFLPLQSIQPRFLQRDVIDRLKKHDGFIGIAADLVETNHEYQKVAKHLMGHTIIARTLKDANDMAKITNRRNRIVTLEGDVVNPGGSISGGAKQKTNQSLFTREKEINELTDKVKAFKIRVSDFEQKVKQKQNELETLENKIAQKEENIEKDKQELQQLLNDNNRLTLEMDSFKKQLDASQKDQQYYVQEEDSLKNKKMTLNQKLKDLQGNITTIQTSINDLTEQETKLSETYEQDQQELHEHQVTLAEYEERLRHQQEKTDGLENSLNDTEHKLMSHWEKLHTLEKLQEETNRSEQLNEQIAAQDKIIQETNIELQDYRSDRMKGMQKIEDEERELREQHKIHQQLVEKVQQTEVKTNRLDVDLKNKLNHLQDTYTITFERAQRNYDQVKDIDQSKQDVAHLKQTMEQLGNVNIGAVEEFERISERYQFLMDQKSDLVEAKQTLYQVIEEMDEVMKKRFDETFTKIKEEFQTVFKALFGGGHAELSMTDPKDLLDTGIDIIAQPPGKKLQHLGLLSGGERALTAIALLFSILRVRPVPFCVLDEVEAALDEANVVRFAKYVKMHSDATQFIVITHRKGTMEEADALYGVTMQESGVSRLISVQLEQTLALVDS